MRKALLLMLALCACKSKPNQSYAQAVKILCGSPDDVDVEHLDPAAREAAISNLLASRLANAEVRALFDALGPMSPDDRVRALDAALARAGLTTCALRDFVDRRPAKLPLADVPGAKLDDAVDLSIAIITPTAVVVEGEEVVAIRDGKLEDPAKLTATLASLAKLAAAKGAPGPLGVAPEKDTTYATLVDVLEAAKGPFPSLALVVNSGDAAGTFPLALPAIAPSEGVQMVLSLASGQVMLFSLSGAEGSLKQPLATFAPDALDQVRGALAAVAGRHPDEKQIVVMADGTATAGVVVPLIEVAHESFPGVALSAAFE